MKYWIFLLLFSVATLTWHEAESTCSLPDDLNGVFIDTLKGALEFSNSTIKAYNLHTFGALTLTCWMQNDTVYIFESSEFEFYSLNFTAYFCWNFTQVSPDMFYFYEFSPVLPGAGNERVRAYLPTLTRVYDSICSNPNPGLGTYRVLFRNGTLDSAISPCPTEIQSHYSVTVRDAGGTDACNNTSFDLDLCSNSSSMIYNNSACNTHLAYSDTGYVYCLFTIEDNANDMLYMSLYNDGPTDESTTYSVTCLIVNYVASKGYLAGTQYPRQCPDSMNETYVTSPGAYVNLYSAGSCSEVSAFPWWILGVVFGLLFLIGLIIFCCYKKQRDEEEKKRRLRVDDDDDERFDPERFARGERPPFVSITIMGDSDRKRDKHGRLLDEVEDDKPVEIKRPKSEGGKRRLDKRKRVWVIDKDGKVKKVWKDSRESPDSGMEDDDGDGEGSSTGRRTLSSQEEREKEMDDAAWAKKHGRKSMKDEKEIVEKGDRKKGSAKLQKKMKGIVSAKRSARFRRSARNSAMTRSGRMDKSASYAPGDDDGERSWGSSDGEYEEVIIENDSEMLKEQEAAENKLNEERERQRKLEGKDVEKAKEKLQGESDIAPVATATVISEIDQKGKKGDKDKKTTGMKKGEKDMKQIETKKGPDQKGLNEKENVNEKEKQKKGEKEGATTDTKKGKDLKTKHKDGSVTDTKEGDVKGTSQPKAWPGGASTAIASTSGITDESTVVGDSRGKGKGKGKTSTGKDNKTESDTHVATDSMEKDANDRETANISGKDEVGIAAEGPEVAALTVAEKKRLEAQEKKEQKQREKEEKKKEKEEKKRKEKEEKEMKKQAAAVQNPVAKYVDVKSAEEANPPVVADTEGKETDIQIPASQTEKKTADTKQTEKKTADTKQTEKKPTDTKQTDKKPTDTKQTDKKPTDTKQTDKKPTDTKQTEKKSTDTKQTEKKPTDTKQTSNKTANTEQTEKKNAEKEQAKKKTADTKQTEKKTVDNTQETQKQLDLSREQTLSSSMRPRREQSVLLDLDSSKSTLFDSNEKQHFNSEQKTLGAVSELVDTAREKADAFAEGKETESPANSADQRSRNERQAPVKGVVFTTENKGHRSRSANKNSKKSKEEREASTSLERGKSLESARSEKKKVETKTSMRKGAKYPEESVVPVTKITVNEADEGSKTDLSKIQDGQTAEERNKEEEEGGSESSEEEVLPVKKKRAQGFTFPDENKLVSTFRTTGDIIHTMPVKKKKPRRKPRNADVDALPPRVSQAFGLSTKAKPGSAAAAPAGKNVASQPSSVAAKGQSGDTTKTLATVKGPITIKDLSKKQPVKEEDMERNTATAGLLDVMDSRETAGGLAKKSPSPRLRRKSELDKKQHMQLMTQLMSLAEGPESEVSSRAQSSVRKGQSKASSSKGFRTDATELNLVGLGDPADRGKNGTPELLQTARQESVVAGRPPNMHSLRPSRESSAVPRGVSGHNVSRSHSEKRTTSVTFPDSSRTGGSHSSSSVNSEERFARFKEGVLRQLDELGKQDMNAILYPRVQRYQDEEDEAGKIRRGAPSYRSMGALQRIHKRNRQVAPLELPPIRGAYGGLIDDYDDVDDPRMRGLLEELYRDKKFIDKQLAKDPVQDDYINQRTRDGRDFLLNRARFWSTQKPIVRPGTQAGSRASTAMPSSRLAFLDDRTRSLERPKKQDEPDFDD